MCAGGSKIKDGIVCPGWREISPSKIALKSMETNHAKNQHMGLRGSLGRLRYWDWHCIGSRDADDLVRGLAELFKAINLNIEFASSREKSRTDSTVHVMRGFRRGKQNRSIHHVDEFTFTWMNKMDDMSEESDKINMKVALHVKDEPPACARSIGLN